MQKDVQPRRQKEKGLSSTAWGPASCLGGRRAEGRPRWCCWAAQIGVGCSEMTPRALSVWLECFLSTYPVYSAPPSLVSAWQSNKILTSLCHLGGKINIVILLPTLYDPALSWHCCSLSVPRWQEAVLLFFLVNLPTERLIFVIKPQRPLLRIFFSFGFFLSLVLKLLLLCWELTPPWSEV